MLGLSGTVGAATLTTSQLASHNHRYYYLSGGASGGGTWDTGAPNNYTGTINTTSTGNSQSHTHGLNNITSNSVSNIPPFYTLTYVMRCA